MGKKKKKVKFAETLWNAAKDGKLDVVIQEIEKCPEDIDTKNPEDNETPLFTACEFGHFEVVKYLVEHGANVNSRRITNSTPCYVAAAYGWANIVEYLLNHGADQTLCMNGDVTPLYIACQDGQLESAKVLIKYGADINYACDDGSTPLHAACNYGNDALVELLLNCNVHIHVLWGSREPLDFAKAKEHNKIVQLIENKIKDVRWSYTRWIWLGFMKESDCLLSTLPIELVKEIADIVSKDVVIL